MTKPQWVLDKENLKNQPEEKLEFIGEPGADGVSDGKLPNGEPYEWTKQNRKHRRKWRIAKT